MSIVIICMTPLVRDFILYNLAENRSKAEHSDMPHEKKFEKK